MTLIFARFFNQLRYYFLYLLWVFFNFQVIDEGLDCHCTTETWEIFCEIGWLFFAYSWTVRVWLFCLHRVVCPEFCILLDVASLLLWAETVLLSVWASVLWPSQLLVLILGYLRSRTRPSILGSWSFLSLFVELLSRASSLPSSCNLSASASPWLLGRRRVAVSRLVLRVRFRMVLRRLCLGRRLLKRFLSLLDHWPYLQHSVIIKNTIPQ